MHPPRRLVSFDYYVLGITPAPYVQHIRIDPKLGCQPDRVMGIKGVYIELIELFFQTTQMSVTSRILHLWLSAEEYIRIQGIKA